MRLDIIVTSVMGAILVYAYLSLKFLQNFKAYLCQNVAIINNPKQKTWRSTCVCVCQLEEEGTSSGVKD